MEREDGDGMMERTEYIEKWKVVNMLIDVENRAQGTYRENGEKLYRDLVETEIKIGKLPAADVAPVRPGRWINAEKINNKPYRIKNLEKWVIYRCSECGYSNGRRTNANYCPNCGAKMDGKEKDYD